MAPDNGQKFITEYLFASDGEKPGRVLDTCRVGEVFVTRMIMNPYVVTGNLYRKETNAILFVTKGKVRFSFVQVNTDERKEIVLEPHERIIHWPPFVACASKNLLNEESVVYFFSNKAFRSDDDYSYEVIPASNTP